MPAEALGRHCKLLERGTQMRTRSEGNTYRLHFANLLDILQNLSLIPALLVAPPELEQQVGEPLRRLLLQAMTHVLEDAYLEPALHLSNHQILVERLCPGQNQ